MASRVCNVLTKAVMRSCFKNQSNILSVTHSKAVLSTVPLITFPSTRHLYTTSNCLAKRKTPKSDKENPQSNQNLSESVPRSFSEEFSPFKDRQRVVQDVIEEQWNPILQEFERPVKVKYERGKTGVFDLGELVHILREERALDICVIKIPQEIDYAEHMIIVTARSPKHMFALATFVRKRFKSKLLKVTDKLPKIEGSKNSEDWIALDLINIVLHIFSHECREALALETLWTVGSQYDDLSNQKDSEIVQLLNLFQ